MRHLPDRRRLSDAVDADKQDDVQAAVLDVQARVHGIVIFQQGNQLLGQDRLQVHRVFDLLLANLGAELVDQLHDGIDPDIGGDQNFFQLFKEVLIDFFVATDEILHLFHQEVSGLGQSVCKLLRDCFRFLYNRIPQAFKKAHLHLPFLSE